LPFDPISMKLTTSFVCQECGYESPSWLGKCPECGVWNSLREFKTQIFPRSGISLRETKFKVEQGKERLEEIKPKTLGEIKSSEKERLSTGFSEMDGVLGGGLVAGSVILLAGDPGIGKSTLLLQVGLNLSNNKSVVLSRQKVAKDPIGLQKKEREEILLRQLADQNDKGGNVLYVSGEESVEQIKLRALRITASQKQKEQFKLLSINDTDAIVEVVEKIKPSLLIIDSIQTMESRAVGGMSGSIAQIRYAAALFTRVAKTLSIPTILVGHVTKEGMVAGPMILSHMVDAVLFFEGEKATNTRILRSFKNRFGPVDEVGIFSMEEKGIKEVKNPQHFLREYSNKPSGSVLASTLEGTRAFLVEIQGLVVGSKLPIPRRVASGIDVKRLELLLAVLQKNASLPLATLDVFVNVAGGLRLTDRGTDLAICLSLFSSLKNISLVGTVAIGEVGLLGELRTVPYLEKRIKEAKKLGFKHIISYNAYKTLNEAIRSLAK